jgi:hypothetical protein
VQMPRLSAAAVRSVITSIAASNQRIVGGARLSNLPHQPESHPLRALLRDFPERIFPAPSSMRIRVIRRVDAAKFGRLQSAL